ncbi:MAG TPA: DinB family protein, partial [Acidobacteriaceae bacterium]|nr:DinB family protein [Acidobacteriaceae bacterium]
MTEAKDTQAGAGGIDLRYPVGKFRRPEAVTAHQRMAAIAVLAELPGRLRDAVEGLDRRQLDTPYREGGWTVRQVVHHLADSHMNALLRMKLALTED